MSIPSPFLNCRTPFPQGRMLPRRLLPSGREGRYSFNRNVPGASQISCVLLLQLCLILASPQDHIIALTTKYISHHHPLIPSLRSFGWLWSTDYLQLLRVSPGNLIITTTETQALHRLLDLALKPKTYNSGNTCSSVRATNRNRLHSFTPGHSIASSQSPPPLVLVALVILYLIRAASAVVTASQPAYTTVVLVCTSDASSRAPSLLLLVVPFSMVLLHEVAALSFGQGQDATAGHAAVTDHKEL